MEKQIIARQDLLNAIEGAGRIVGQVLDGWHETKSERNSALFKVHDFLSSTYFKATGLPLEWWRVAD
jgi:hypothetical protein